MTPRPFPGNSKPADAALDPARLEAAEQLTRTLQLNLATGRYDQARHTLERAIERMETRPPDAPDRLIGDLRTLQPKLRIWLLERGLAKARDLVQLRPEDILTVRGMGHGYWRQIEDTVAGLGLKWPRVRDRDGLPVAPRPRATRRGSATPGTPA